MSSNCSLFPGAMGPHGFISCFDHLLPADQVRRKIILKGGPGVGKSTFMRRIHAALCPDDQSATLCFCSGDPDSLDAVVFPDRGLVILDGTAPHVIDPEIPGARDSLVNLGAYLDESALRSRLAPIRACMAEHALVSARARACMRAAEALAMNSADIVRAALNEAQLSRMTRELTHTVLFAAEKPCGAPSVRPVITEAITSKGELSFIRENAQPRVIRLVCPWAMDPTDILRAVSAVAIAAGYSVEEHLCTAVPGRLLHISVPAMRTLVTTDEHIPAEQTFDFGACLPASALLHQECVLEQNRSGIRLHLHQAVDSLFHAKQLHDELESFYVPCMDFSGWQRELDKTLETLEAPEQ